ncbi:hypothetical protein TNCV_3149201 [Trichonephila clavipes]|nr:hypothetical protein TNCV_3149201 [Trichonephila clavipes]
MIQRKFLLATGRRVTNRTIRNRLHAGGRYARRSIVYIPLTARDCAARRNLEGDTSLVLVRQEREIQNNPIFILESSHFKRDGLTVWAGVSNGARTDLHIFRNSKLLAQRLMPVFLQRLVKLKQYRLIESSRLLIRSSTIRRHLVDALLQD